MGVTVRATAGPVIEKPGDLAGMLTTLQAHEVLFIDEIHRLAPAIEEILYPAMEDFELDIVIGEGPSARSVKVELQRFTLVGATTRAGLLTAPLRSRFGIVHRLDFYNETDIVEIVRRSARILGVPIDGDAAREVGRRSRGTPRIANRLLRRVRDYAQVRADGTITTEVAHAALSLLEVDEHGFDEVDRKLLRTIIDKFGGGPVGVNSIAAADPRREGRHRRHLRAVPDPGRLPRSHAARPRGHGACLRVFRAHAPSEGPSPVVTPAPRTVARARISSLAIYVPPRLLTNADLEKMVDTSDEWIQQRTGIKQRHIVDPGVATSDLATEAARKAIERAGLTPPDIDFIVVGTTTPDMAFPSTACLVQHNIGATRAWGYDLSAACSGFTYALTTAANMVGTGGSKHALVIGADVMSSIIDYTDRATCVIFGDGAGAAVVEASTEDGVGIIDFENYVDGSGGQALKMPGGGSRHPASHETIDQRLHYVKQDGQTVFRFAVRNTEEACRRLLERNKVSPDDIDLFVSHQANRRIIFAAAEKLGVPEKKVVINIEQYGNTTAATIPLALNTAVEDKRLKKGDLLLMVSVGAGFTVGAMLLRWGLKE